MDPKNITYWQSVIAGNLAAAKASGDKQAEKNANGDALYLKVHGEASPALIGETASKAPAAPAKPLSPELQATVDRALGKTTAKDAAVVKAHRLYSTNLQQMADKMISKGMPGADIVECLEAAEQSQIANARATRKGELKAAMAHALKARQPQGSGLLK